LPARGGRAVIGIAAWRRRGAWLESMAWVVWYIAYIEAMAVMRMDNGLKAPMPSLARWLSARVPLWRDDPRGRGLVVTEVKQGAAVEACWRGLGTPGAGDSPKATGLQQR